MLGEQEFNEWAAYYRLEPWGPERADINAGIIASTLANCHRDPKRRPEPFTPADFMPTFGRQEERGDESKGMDPQHVMSVMTRMKEHQAMREKMLGRTS